LFENGEMNLAIIFAVALGCFIAECLWPAMKLPRVNAWWGRVILINCTQLGITILAGRTWNRWLNHVSLFDLKEHCGDWSSALIIYLFSTFVYYWWHRYRHESQFLWRTLHQIHHSARRLEIVTRFLKTSRGDLDQFDPQQCNCVPFIRWQPSRGGLLHDPHSRW
jgi:sterol desaturase/sphingolipid hydroxylase (fatty acid hydroxylase superfamily)